MSTGSIHSASKTLHKQLALGLIHQTFTAGAEIKAGQPAKLTANATVEPAGPSDDFIGSVIVGGKTGDLVTVLVSYTCDALVKITGASASVNQLVTYNGTVGTDGVPEVTIAASGELAKGIVLSGGSDGSEIRIGVLATAKTVA